MGVNFNTTTKQIDGETGLWQIELNSGRTLYVLQSSDRDWRAGTTLSFQPSNTYKVWVVRRWSDNPFNRDKIVQVREVYVDASQVCFCAHLEGKFTVDAKLVSR